MNPNAKPFVFRPAAQEWTPSWATPPAAPAPAEPAPVPEAVAPPPVPEPVVEAQPVAAVEAEVMEGDEGEDDVDENDPLWIAVLKLANGNRKEALKMLDDPDALMAYPEIAKIMESGEGTEDIDESKTAADDWEKADSSEVQDGETKSDSRPSKAVTQAVDEEDALPLEAEVEVDGDPRDHMNLVFIGHVDAGKSTLSGSILYLMGKVDARTIERFEKEAKQRNRESWFLAFIMVGDPYPSCC
jgi:peptide chain release factor subunit 3